MAVRVVVSACCMNAALESARELMATGRRNE